MRLRPLLLASALVLPVFAACGSDDDSGGKPKSTGGTGGGTSTGSCVGNCNSSNAVPGSNPACYCDSSCTQYNDCCADKAAACGS